MRAVSRRVVDVQAGIVLSAVYWCTIGLRKGNGQTARGWQPWTMRSDTLSDLRKQY